MNLNRKIATGLAVLSMSGSIGLAQEVDELPLFTEAMPSTLIRQLEATGLRVETLDSTVFMVFGENGETVLVMYEDCAPTGCRGIRAVSAYNVGKNAQALEAARYYEATVPSAMVTIIEGEDKDNVMVGRDIVMGPGRTQMNIYFQVMHVIEMQAYFQRALMENNPELQQMWLAQGTAPQMGGEEGGNDE